MNTKRTLSRKLFVYFLIVIVLSLSTVGVFSYVQSSRALAGQVQQYLDQMINNAAYQTDIYLQTYELMSNSFVSNPDVRSFLDIQPDDSYEYYAYSERIKKFAASSIVPIETLYRQVNMIYVLGHHHRAVSYDNQNLLFYDPATINDHYNELMSLAPDNGKIALLDMSIRPEDRGTVITMARKVRGASYKDDYKGIVAIEIKLQELAKIWQRINIGKGGFFFIVDNNGNYIYRPADRMKDRTMDPVLARHILDNGNDVFSSHYDGEDRMFVARHSDYSRWTLVASMPVGELRLPIATIRSTTLAVGIATLAISLWLAARFGRSIIAPIRALKDSMRETEKGNWQYIEQTDRTVEIGGLIHSYNLMVTRLSDMVEIVYEAELSNQKALLDLQETQFERQRAEFQALQLQINPHFLYNTLETINCYAIVQDSDEITEMVEALSFMFRYSTQTNLEEITVANELKHVLNYMAILKHRIQREFEIDVVIPPSLLLEKMVRLTLQPMIENIFQHAFFEGLQPHHYIRIDARKQKGLFQVIVEDNGAGIRPERLAELHKGLQRNRLAEQSNEGGSGGRKGGIGLMNVHRRIQMVFGEKYGLAIESEWGQGSRITLNMPDTAKRQQHQKNVEEEASGDGKALISASQLDLDGTAHMFKLSKDYRT